jgi:hypothetical protein
MFLMERRQTTVGMRENHRLSREKEKEIRERKDVTAAENVPRTHTNTRRTPEKNKKTKNKKQKKTKKKEQKKKPGNQYRRTRKKRMPHRCPPTIPNDALSIPSPWKQQQKQQAIGHVREKHFKDDKSCTQISTCDEIDR